MPVLLLAYGDPKAKDLLRRAIETRYGVRPPAIESLELHFKGRARAKVGPVATWVPVEAAAYFQFPKAMRWDFVVKPLGLPVQRGVEAFDGEVVRVSRGNKTPAVVDDPAQIDHLQQRLWAIAAILLTPLGESFVKLSHKGANSFTATNTLIGDTVDIYLHANNAIDYVSTYSTNPDTERQQQFIVRLSETQTEIDGLMLPGKISAYWDDELTFELEPVTADSNAKFLEAVFTLTEEVTTSSTGK